MARQAGRVIAAHGRHFLVAIEPPAAKDGPLECVMRGKKGGVACGDHVEISPTHPGSGVIEQVLPRRNLLYRSDQLREKLIAANVDQALIVVAAVPQFREELLIRCLAACEAAEIPAVIILNKIDLPESAALASSLEHYAGLGYPVIHVSAHGDIAALATRAAGQVSVLVGASGMGKSSLLNRLVPDAAAAVGDISVALDAGRHTTTQARLHRLPVGGAVIDSPGMQEFGLRHLDASTLTQAFPEIRARVGQCRFYNCRHLKEPGCAVLEAAASGAIRSTRLRVYQSLIAQSEGPTR